MKWKSHKFNKIFSHLTHSKWIFFSLEQKFQRERDVIACHITRGIFAKIIIDREKGKSDFFHVYMENVMFIVYRPWRYI